MSTVRLRYVGGITHVDVPILGREGEPLDDHGVGCLVSGEEFDCDASVAGKAPKVNKDGEITDYGSGLLAQVGNFEVVDDTRKSKKSEV